MGVLMLLEGADMDLGDGAGTDDTGGRFIEVGTG